MESSKQQQKGCIWWDPDAERKLIEIWAQLPSETGGKMLTRKKKEALATSQLNMHLEKELNKYTLYTEPMGQLAQLNLQNLLGLGGW